MRVGEKIRACWQGESGDQFDRRPQASSVAQDPSREAQRAIAMRVHRLLSLGFAAARVIEITVEHQTYEFLFPDEDDPAATAIHICGSIQANALYECVQRVGFAIQSQDFSTPAWGEKTNLSATAIRFVQVGANCGTPECAVCGEAIWPDATAPLRTGTLDEWRGVVVEPNPDVFERLARNYAATNRRVTALELAVCEFDGFATLFVDRTMLETASLIAPELASGVYDEVRVECVSLATLWEREVATRFGSVDILLLDTEMYEHRILMATDVGALIPKPRHILFESIHLSADERADVRGHLAQAGYARFQDWGGCGDPQHDTLASLA